MTLVYAGENCVAMIPMFSHDNHIAENLWFIYTVALQEGLRFRSKDNQRQARLEHELAEQEAAEAVVCYDL